MAAVGRNQAGLNALGDSVSVQCVADLTELGSCARVVAEAAGAMGGVDVLINSGAPRWRCSEAPSGVFCYWCPYLHLTSTAIAILARYGWG